ncbi:hypothetical protein ACIBSV_46795 [Embleya sp. NPDC050154]|uniref:hypothetical protein n=1 Tax=Embleya sp. NPDC050154 TaxID=3363988 RepID=UPI003790F576
MTDDERRTRQNERSVAYGLLNDLAITLSALPKAQFLCHGTQSDWRIEIRVEGVGTVHRRTGDTEWKLD